MFCSEKVEAECFDLIRKTSPHFPNYSFKTDFCQRQHVPTEHLAPGQPVLPTEAAQPGRPAGGEQEHPELSPSARLLPIPDGSASRDVPKHRRPRGERATTSRAGSGASPARPKAVTFPPNVFTG